MSARLFATPTAVVVVALAVVAAFASAPGAASTPAASDPTGQVRPQAQVTPTGDETANATSDAACEFDRVYDRVVDSVVSIRVFDERGERGLGSGWVYAVEGSTALVVTNWHVIRGAVGADVRFANDEWRPVGELLGADPYADLAVLRVENVSADVEALTLSDAPPDRGDRVAALGSPLGLEGSITTGVVSARDRAVTVGIQGGLYTVADAVQIDAAVNPGNSGGPLVDCAGEVVGVNFAGVDPTVGQNVNFAVSHNMVERVVPALVENGTYAHSFLGVRAIIVSPTVARVNDLDPTTEGVLVVTTIAGSPADDALEGSPNTERVTGIPIGGDVVVAVEGTPVSDVEGLRDYLSDETRPGDRVRLTVLRDGERAQITVVLGERPLPIESPVDGNPSV